MQAEELRQIADLFIEVQNNPQNGSVANEVALTVTALRAQADKLDERAAQSHPDGMTFEAALYAIKNGSRVKRYAWANKWVALHRPPILAGDEKMSLQYIYTHTHGETVPWQPTQLDMLTVDWSVVR